ncbi:hypothetical protein [Mesorhizobium sp.]|uniref:hypothetical protein n=1 Tax=Mesorhizobium sp. TaxID=1871066 RepID=UPI0025C24DD0|nr:hypothetical protein [Mesorhizobium sp.]
MLELPTLSENDVTPPLTFLSSVSIHLGYCDMNAPPALSPPFTEDFKICANLKD